MNVARSWHRLFSDGPRLLAIGGSGDNAYVIHCAVKTSVSKKC